MDPSKDWARSQMFGHSSVDVSFGFSVEDLSMNHHISGRRNWGRFVPQRNLKTRGEANEEQGEEEEKRESKKTTRS